MKKLHWTNPILSELSELVDSDGRAYASVSIAELNMGLAFFTAPPTVLGIEIQEGHAVVCIEWLGNAKTTLEELTAKIQDTRARLRESAEDGTLVAAVGAFGLE